VGKTLAVEQRNEADAYEFIATNRETGVKTQNSCTNAAYFGVILQVFYENCRN